MSRIAIIGAAGFVGMRLAELAWLGGEFDFVPVIRNFKSFARLSKYGRPCQFADAGDAAALERVLSGCDTAVNLTMGDDARTLSDTQTLLAACEAARVRVLVHLSTAEVFGRVESPTVADDSPPTTNHWMAYARAKIATETWLRPRLAISPVRVVTLRPGLIWGPRSPWVVGPASALLDGTACLFDGGRGVCNLMHVDHLAHCILKVARHPDPTPGFYNVGDPETVTWRQYFETLAAQMRLTDPRLHELPLDSYHESVLCRLLALKNTAFARAIKRRLRSQTKMRIQSFLKRISARWSGAHSAVPAAPVPQVTKSMWWLQGNRHKLPTAKFTQTFGQPPGFSSAEAMERTGAWLRFSGFTGGWRD